LAGFALIISLFLCAHTEASAQDKAYRIGPNDVLTLTIYAGGEKQHDADLSVSSRGLIQAPFIGPVKAGGLTISELTSSVTEALAKDYFINPEVNIQIKEYHSLRYYVSGAVSSPGLYEMPSEVTLMELIAKAGGALPERGNIAYILRSSEEESTDREHKGDPSNPKVSVTVDLKRLLDKGDMAQNLVLQSGDMVYIPHQKAANLGESKVYVEGEVKSPGVYEFQEGLTALNACIMAGGFDKFAAPNRTKIIRKKGEEQEIIQINLDEVKKGKSPDIELKPGDRIHVPETWL
jgi:polysaccharide export outer membrane protein